MDDREAFLDSVELEVVKTAKKVGMRIRIERESRGRYPTFSVRAVEQLEKVDPVIESRIVDGVRDKKK